MVLRRAARVPGWVWAVVAAVLFGLAQLPAAPNKLTPDSAAYLLQTLDLLGRTPAQARTETITAFCAGYRAGRVVNLNPTGPVAANYGAQREAACVDRLTREGQADSTNRYGPAITEGTQLPSPRYEAIFLSRPGTAVVFAPLVAVAGPLWGMWLTVLCCTLAAALLIYLLLRTLGLGWPAAVLGQVLYFVLPTGTWSMFLLGEAPVLLLTVVVLLGATYAVKGRLALGAGLVTVAFLAGMFVKYSQFLLIAACLAAMAVTATAVHRRISRPVLVIGGVALIWIPVLLGVSALLGWPGGAESMQDLLTDRFTSPDVANPVPKLIRLNLYFWSWWLVQQLAAPLLLASWTFSAVILRWSRTPIWWAVVAVFLSGLATQAGHPLTTQGDRLYVSAWLLVVIAIPLLADHLAHRNVANQQSPQQFPANDDTVVLPRQRIPEQQGQTRTGTPTASQGRFNR